MFEGVAERLAYPKLPGVVKSEFVGPDPDHAPTIKQNDSDRNRVEHGFGSELEALLDKPECIDADGLKPNYINSLRDFAFEKGDLPVQRYPRSEDT